MRISGLTNADPALANMVATRRKSVNDFVRAQIKSIEARRDLSAEDRRRLDAPLSPVRDLEVGIATVLARNLMAFAFAGDVSRTATLKIGDNNDSWQTQIDGTRQPSFHLISHGVLADGGDGPPIANAEQLHAKILRNLISQFDYLVGKLAAVSSPTGALLDRGYYLWGNQVSNGNHDMRNMPYVIAGNANGRLKTRRFVEAGGVTHNMMLNTLLAAAGVSKTGGTAVDDFGHITLKKGLIPALLA